MGLEQLLTVVLALGHSGHLLQDTLQGLGVLPQLGLDGVSLVLGGRDGVSESLD